MSAPRDYTFREFEPVAFPKNCTGDNANESWRAYVGDAMSTMANGNHRDGVTDGTVRQSDYSTVEKPLEEQEYLDDTDVILSLVNDGEYIDEHQILMDMESSMQRSVAKSTVANGNHLYGVTDDIFRKPDYTVVGHRVNRMIVYDGENIDLNDFLKDTESSNPVASGHLTPVAIQHVSKFLPNLSTMDVGGSGALLANTAALATSERSVAMSTMANGERSDTDLPYFMKSPMMLDMSDPGVPRADTVSLSTSSDGQSIEASLHAYGDGPYGEEGNDTNMLAPEPTVALSVCAGAARSLSPKLELVKKFDKPLTPDLLATISEMNEVKAMKIPKKELLFKTLSTFMLLQPRGTPRLEGGQVWNGLIRQEEFHELVNKSKLNPAVMSEVTALLMYMKTKMDFIGESFYLLIASCMIGKGVYYCSSRTNATSQYRVLKAVYEAIIEKKPRKQRGQKTP